MATRKAGATGATTNGVIFRQVTPRVLTEAITADGDEVKRAFETMMDMKKIDVIAIEATRRG